MTNKKYSERQVLKILYESMYFIHTLFVKYGIPYSIDFGTLLGAVRHKGIIPWDNDIDMEVNESFVPIILSKEFRKILKENNLKIRKHPDGWLKVWNMKYNFSNFDIFISKLDSKGNVILKGRAQEFFPQHLFKPKEMFPLKEYRFGKIKVLGPNNPIPYLNRVYGRGWDKVGYITQDPKTHLEYDKPIKIKITKFVPGKDFYYPPKGKKVEIPELMLEWCYFLNGSGIAKKLTE